MDSANDQALSVDTRCSHCLVRMARDRESKVKIQYFGYLETQRMMARPSAVGNLLQHVNVLGMYITCCKPTPASHRQTSPHNVLLSGEERLSVNISSCAAYKSTASDSHLTAHECRDYKNCCCCLFRWIVFKYLFVRIKRD